MSSSPSPTATGAVGSADAGSSPCPFVTRAPLTPRLIPRTRHTISAGFEQPTTPPSPRSGSRRWLPDTIGIIVLLGMIGVVSWDGLRAWDDLYRLDNITFYVPIYGFLGDRLVAGDIPGWNPYIFGGQPFAGDPQSGWMYLPAMVLFAILPAIQGFAAFMIFHLALGGLATYVLGRLLGFGPTAAVVAGTAFVFTPLLEHTRCCTIRAQVAPWVPLAMLGAELAVRATTWPGRIAWACLAAVAGSQMIGGWIGQGAYYGLLATGSFLLYRAVIAPPPGVRPFRVRLLRLVILGATILVVAFGLAAAGLLVRLDAIERTNLSDGDYTGSVGAEAQTGLWDLSTAVSRLFTADDDRYGRWYIGAAVFALALIAPALAGRRFGVPFFAVYTATVIGLGMDIPGLQELFGLLPEFSTLHSHVQNRIWTILQIGPAMLAGASVQGLRGWGRRPLGLGLLALVPILALLPIRTWVTSESETISDGVPFAIVSVSAVLLALALALALVAQKRLGDPIRLRALRFAPVLLLAIVFVDPAGWWLFNTNPAFIDNNHQPERLAKITDPTADGPAAFLQRQAAADGPFRYFGYDPGFLSPEGGTLSYHGRYRSDGIFPLIVYNRSLFLGLEDIQGYNPVQIARYTAFMTTLNGGAGQEYHETTVRAGGLDSPLLDLLNVRYAIVSVAPNLVDGRDRWSVFRITNTWPTAYEDETVRVLENPGWLPRAWIVHSARTMPGDQATNLLAYEANLARETALLETSTASLSLSQPADPATDSAVVIANQPDEMIVRTITDAPGVLLLSEIYDPGWNAYVDGDEVDVLAANGALRAVPIPAGEHDVSLRYEPESLRQGLVISAATAALVAALWLFCLARTLRGRLRSFVSTR